MKIWEAVGFVRGIALAIGLFTLSLMPQPSHAQIVRVGWTPIVSARSGQCLDIQGMSTQSGAIAQQVPCQFKSNEQWNLQPTANGFLIVEEQDSLCLTATGSAIVQAACGGIGSVWTINASGNAFKLGSVKSAGLCLTPIADSNGAGVAMTLRNCNDGNLATWAFQSGLIQPTQLATLQANHSGQCMMIAAAGTTYAGNLVQNPCAGTPPEQWLIIPTANTYQYAIVYGNTGLCLSAASATAGASIAPSACTGSTNQLFSFWAGQTTGYLINITYTSLCFDVSGASTAPGTQIVLASCSAGPDEEWSVASASVPVSWTGVIPLATDPIAIANLPNGTLLTWATYDLFSYEGDIGNNYGSTYYSIFKPSTLTSGPVLTEAAHADMFCPGTANLADGRVLINGGSSSSRTTIYNPATGKFAADSNMNVPRGYEGDTLLSNGSVLTLGGSWNSVQGGKTGEVWTSGQGWAELSGVPETNVIGPDPEGVYRGDNHLWLFSLANGLVLHAGPSAQMNWIFTSGSGAIYPAGQRGDDAYSINGNAVMYDVGKILKAGGSSAYDEGTATTSAYTITIGGSLQVAKVAPMAYARGFSSGVALPNGQVLIVGGQTITEPFTDTYAVLVPELWDPLTGVFQQLAPMQTPRTYHSTAILLNDGRVFVGGGGQCGYGCSANHFNTEVLTPPYLLNANGSAATRPTIKSAPATAPLGSTISVQTSMPITSFALMRNSSITHTVNNDQRRIPLLIQSSAQSGSNSNYTLNIPTDPGVALPGYYMLFGMNVYGVPSVATSILIH